MPEFLSAFAGVIIATLALAPISVQLGWVDQPSRRKQHQGAVPLVGGIAMFASITLAALFFVPRTPDMAYLLAACALVTMTGSLDDRYNLNYRVRLIVQALSAGLLIWGAGIDLNSLGPLLAPLWDSPFQLGWFSVPVTVLAVVGMINAYNMIDGMDGLAGGLSLITTVALYLLLGRAIGDEATSILLLMMGALSAYLILNLHLFPRYTPKVFMGDAGSMLLGLIITAFLIRYSQGTRQMIMPVTALWLVAVPLMDIFVTCFRRMKHGKSPFHPDRTHIHHIFMRARLSKRTTLVLILGVQGVAAGIGVALDWLQVGAGVSLLAFLVLFFLYLEFVKHAFVVAKWIRRLSA